MSKNYTVVSGLIFGFVSLVHVARALTTTPVVIGNSGIPMWVSWVGAVVAAALCVWAFRSR